MKKFLAIILSFFYLGIATGFTTYSHYCMDRYAGTSLWNKASNTCSLCGMALNADASHQDGKGCCKSEQKQIKLDQVHQAGETAKQQLSVFTAVVPTPAYTQQQGPALYQGATASPFSHAPPKAYLPPIYILHCVYLI